MKRTIALLLLCCLPGRAATYYVAKDGNDVNAGTSLARAWLTVAKATKTVAAGDTVYFGPGTWAEELTTAADGTSAKRITWDGQGHASIQRLTVNKAYNTFRNLTISGWLLQAGYAYHVNIRAGGDWTVLYNNKIICSTNFQGGIYIHSETLKPWDDKAAANCQFLHNRVENISGEYAAFNIAGTNNLVAYNVISNGIRANPFYLFGRSNILRNNLVQGLSPDPTTMGWPLTNMLGDHLSYGHPDLLQTFGVNGDGSYGHLVERNVFLGDWSPELQATNAGLAGYTVAGGQLTVGGGLVVLPSSYTNDWFEVSIQRFGAPYEWVKGENELSLEWGGGILTNSGVFHNTSASSIVRITGNRGKAVTCALGNCAFYSTVGDYFGGWTFRNNIFANTKSAISMGLPRSTWENNLFYRIGYGNTGHPLSMSVVSHRADANGFIVRNNVFLDCGSSAVNAWYNIGSVTNYYADYNFVQWNGGPVRYENPPSAFRWYEPNGINGANPLFINPEQFNFRLMAGSPLIDAGTGMASVDIEGWQRPMGGANDIGPYEFDPNLRVWLDFDQGFQFKEYIADVSGYGHHAFFPMETHLAAGLTNWADPNATFGPPDFNGYPDPPITNRIRAVESVNGTLAGQWIQVGNMTNDPGKTYVLSQYAAITNLNQIEFLPRGTVSMWVQWGTIADGCVRGATVLDTGYTIPYSYPPQLATNAWSLRYGPPYAGDAAIGPQLSRYSDNYSYPSNLVQFTQKRDATTWYHLVVTWDSDARTVKGYQDGVPVATNEFLFPHLRVSGRDPANPPWSAAEAVPWIAVGAGMHAGSLTWGDDRYPNDRFFVGKMDDLRIYDRPISAAEAGRLSNRSWGRFVLAPQRVRVVVTGDGAP